MKKIIFIVCIFSSFLSNSQVGIGTTAPNALLDIRPLNSAAPVNTDGLLIPKMSVFPTPNPTSAQRGMLVFLTNVVGLKGPGFYYWENFLNDWVSLFDTNNSSMEWTDFGTYIRPTDGTNENVAIGLGSSGNARLDLGSDKMMGVYTNVSNTTTPANPTYAFYNEIFGPGINYGTYNNFSTNSSGEQYGTYNVMTNASSSYRFGLRNQIQGGGQNFGVYNQITTSGGNPIHGTYNVLESGGSAISYGTLNDLRKTGTGVIYGNHTTISQNNTGDLYGSYLNIATNNNNSHYGNYNLFSGTGSGNRYGQYNYFNSSNAQTTGVLNEIITQSTDAYGIRNNINANMNSIAVYNTLNGTNSVGTAGMVNEISNTNGTIYGVNTNVSDTFSNQVTGYRININSTASGGGSKYGVFTSINQSAGGQHYGIYSEALKSGSFAGYFMGNVNIYGRLTLGSIGSPYSLPQNDGSSGNTLQTDGAGNVNWTDASTKPYTTTGASTGIYFVTQSQHTIRILNPISEIRLPNAAGNTGKIYIIIGSNGITSKTWSTSGGTIYDDVTNATITAITTNQRYSVQSDGTNWIVIGR